MTISLKKWGNSLGLRIPVDIVRTLNLHVDEKIQIEVINNKMIITKETGLEELLKDWPIEAKAKSYWDGIKPAGKEIW